MNWKLYGRKQSLHVSRYYLAFGRRDWNELQKKPQSEGLVPQPRSEIGTGWDSNYAPSADKPGTLPPELTCSVIVTTYKDSQKCCKQVLNRHSSCQSSVSACHWVTCIIFLRNVNHSTDLSLHCSCSSAAASSFTETTSHSSTSSCTTNIASAGLKDPLLLLPSAHCQDITSHMAWRTNVHVSKLFGHF